MDFTLSLTHFCEIHGPKSVLCTQVLPLECALCHPPSPSLHPHTSTESLRTQVRDPVDSLQSSSPPSLRHADTDLTLSTDFSGASTTVDSLPDSPIIERHPLFKNEGERRHFEPQFRYGRAQGETCASCSFSVPDEVARQLPSGAPGSIKPDGKTRNGAPVLRSREFVCMRGRKDAKEKSPSEGLLEGSSSQGSTVSSVSNSSSPKHTNCHDHLLTYLTAKSPDDLERYQLLRNSVVRTLSCEQLPRGTSDGPFCFGDPNSGYTIAYAFRLPDPKARGRRRAYALLALAGKDANRAFRACPTVWEAFAAMAQAIEKAAQRHQTEQKLKEENDGGQAKTRNYTPVSSFLTQRTCDPDGYVRRTGGFTPRSLAEIVGDPNIFTVLHQYFVAMLRHLGDRFGGLPLADKPSVYQTLANDQGIEHQDLSTAQVHAELVDELAKTRIDDDKTPTPTPMQPALFPPQATRSTPQTKVLDDVELTKAKIAKSLKRNSQCAPLNTSSSNASTTQRSVVV